MIARRVSRLGLGCCAAGAALGLVGLLGWSTGFHVLTYVVPGRPSMMPNTALGLALAGLGALLRGQRTPRWATWLSIVAGVAVAAIGAATLGEYLSGRSFGVDELLLETRAGPPHPGRPSPPTAGALLLLGCALVAFDAGRDRGARPSQWPTIIAGFVGLVTLVAHGHGAGAMYQMARSPVIGVALPTSIAILLLSLGYLMVRPDIGVMTLVCAPGAGGVLMRRLGLGAVVAPPLLGLAASRIVSIGGTADVPLALALLTTGMVPFGVLVVHVTAARLERAHEALELGSERIRSFVDQASDGIFVADREGRYVEVNAAGCRILGYTRDEIIGKTIVDLIPAAEVERLRSDQERMLGGAVSVAEWHLRRKDGVFIPVEVSAKMMADGRWQGLVRDISLRKAAEQEAQRSRARLEGIISISSDAIISIDDQQRIVLYNDGARTIFGWPAEEILGQPLDVLIPERFRHVHADHVRRFAGEPGRARSMSVRSGIFGLRRNGQEFPADASISKVEIDERTFFTVVLRDVTAQMELERKVRETRDFLDNVLQSSVGYSIVALDLGRQVVLWNEGARRTHGYEASEVMGQAVELLHANEDLASGVAQSLYAGALERGTAEAVLRLKRKDGTQFVAQVVVARRVDGDARPVGYLVVSRDVSVEQGRADHERLLGEVGAAMVSTLDVSGLVDKFAELMARSLTDGCLVDLIDPQGTYETRAARHRDAGKATLMNELRRATLDRSKPHLAWAAIERRQSVVVPHVTAEYLESMPQEPRYADTLRGLDLSGFMTVPIIVRDELLGAVVFISSTPRRRFGDTDRARAEELVWRLALALENARLYEAVQQALAGRDEVLRIVAHDLRNPLAAARLGVESLLHLPVEDDRRLSTRRLAERMGRSLDRAARLIDDLLDVSKMEAGRLQVEAVAAAPERLVQDAVDLLAPAATAAALSLAVEVEPGLPRVWADGGRIVQVLSNLVGNALKFVPAGGHVRVAVERYGGMVRFAVIDDGPGIGAEQLPHLFDRFWQAKLTDRRGAGLGLAIVKGLVEAHGGSVWVESRPGEGTTFFFTLRLAPELEARPSEARPA